MYGQGPAAAAAGLIQHVIGTPEELKKNNLDPQFVASCSPQVKGENQGCAHWHTCIFAQMRYGAFRGNGARNIGYFHQTHEGTRIEKQASCEWYMDKMHPRAKAGKRDREDGMNGEIVQIIAIEPGLDHPLSGQKIHASTIVNENQGTNLPHKWVRKITTGPVDKFPRLGERNSHTYYDTLLGDRLAVREAQDEMMNDPPMRVDPGKVEPVGEMFAEPVEDATEEVVVKRGPGRPRKDAQA